MTSAVLLARGTLENLFTPRERHNQRHNASAIYQRRSDYRQVLRDRIRFSYAACNPDRGANGADAGCGRRSGRDHTVLPVWPSVPHADCPQRLWPACDPVPQLWGVDRGEPTGEVLPGRRHASVHTHLHSLYDHVIVGLSSKSAST